MLLNVEIIFKYSGSKKLMQVFIVIIAAIVIMIIMLHTFSINRPLTR